MSNEATVSFAELYQDRPGARIAIDVFREAFKEVASIDLPVQDRTLTAVNFATDIAGCEKGFPQLDQKNEFVIYDVIHENVRAILYLNNEEDAIDYQIAGADRFFDIDIFGTVFWAASQANPKEENVEEFRQQMKKAFQLK